MKNHTKTKIEQLEEIAAAAWVAMGELTKSSIYPHDLPTPLHRSLHLLIDAVRALRPRDEAWATPAIYRLGAKLEKQR